MIDPTIVSALVAAAQALAAPLLDAFLGALSDDAREAVIEQLDRDEAALAATPSSRDDMRALREKHRARIRAHRQARAESARDRYGILDTTGPALERLRAGGPVSHEDRDELRAVIRLVGAVRRGELAPALPPVLDAPVGAWTEPSSRED